MSSRASLLAVRLRYPHRGRQPGSGVQQSPHRRVVELAHEELRDQAVPGPGAEPEVAGGEHCHRRGYTLIPGSGDGIADTYARGDVWILRYRGTELDDGNN